MAAAERPLCALVAGVLGAARLKEKLGDAEALRAVERCANRIERAVAGHKGRVMRSGGEDVLAVFDDAEDGLRAAIDMQQKIDGLPPISGVRMAVRVGLAYGIAIEDDGKVIGEAANAATRVAALAKPAQIVANAACAELLVAHSLQRPVEARDGDAEVCEIVWHEPQAGGKPEPRLRLRHGSDELIVGPARPIVTLGRDRQCDVVILDARASRAHGRIELRGESFVLVDASSNGSYVCLQGETEFQLKGGETALRGRGRIAFGHAWTQETKETVEFFVEE